MRDRPQAFEPAADGPTPEERLPMPDKPIQREPFESQRERLAAEGPARRRFERLRKYRGIIAFAFGGLWVALLVCWIAFGQPDSWQEWRTKMKLTARGAWGASRSGGVKPAEQSGDTSYEGEGNAKLGNYSVKMFDPVSRTTLRTDFSLEGLTTFNDKPDFEKFMQRNQRFFREQVMVTLRNCDSRDLADPRLTLLEKKLVSRVNRSLGKRVLRSAKIKDLTLYESTDNSMFVQRSQSGMAAPAP